MRKDIYCQIHSGTSKVLETYVRDSFGMEYIIVSSSEMTEDNDLIFITEVFRFEDNTLPCGCYDFSGTPEESVTTFDKDDCLKAHEKLVKFYDN